jgi:quercetin dioxygenase-like cupin family protein
MAPQFTAMHGLSRRSQHVSMLSTRWECRCDSTVHFFGGNAMKRTSSFGRMTLVIGVLVSGFEAGPIHAGEAPAMVPRQLLLKKTVQLAEPTVETRIVRVRFPSGYKTPLHTHEGPGPRYVLTGKLRIEDGGQSHVYGSGDVFWETGTAMTVENIGGNDAEMVIFELAPAK